MRPYGWRKLMWRDEDAGPTSKHTGGVLRGRHRSRQLLHRAGRRQGRSEVREQLVDAASEPTFVCQRCGDIFTEDERGNATECCWC